MTINLEQNKVDIQIREESTIKKLQDVFQEVKEEKSINVESFFIDGNDIFDSEEISKADREFIIDLINRPNLIVYAKRFVEESNASKMEIVHPEEKNWQKRTNIDWWRWKERKCERWKQFDKKKYR